MSGSQEIMIAQGIDVSQYREATLMVRVHQLSVGGTGTLEAEVFGDAPTSEDPAQTFLTSSALVVSSSIDSSTSAPVLILATVPDNFGAALAVKLKATPDTNTPTLAVIISIDLSLKD